jgi:NAD(P)-dependent dehydrogenase (short-subunit alcohol dehydrogenase family)
MQVADKVAIVTGGGSGIGAAVAQRLAAEGAAGVLVADRDLHRATAVAGGIGPQALAVRCDVGIEADIQALVGQAQDRFGRVDLYVSNAGILGPAGGVEIEDAIWESMWKIHVMAHVWAARAVLPAMVQRGEGYFLVTASAAGLLNIVETAPYGVTKHAAVGFAEWLSIAYGRRGIKVSCLCPQSVRTEMTAQGAGSAGVDGVLSAEQVAQAVLETLGEENFLCLPHPEVVTYLRRKTENYDRWLGGMQKMFERHVTQGAQSALRSQSASVPSAEPPSETQHQALGGDAATPPRRRTP